MSILDKTPQPNALVRLLLGTSSKTRVISAAALFLAACAFGAAGMAPMAPDPANLPVESIHEELSLPQLSEQLAAFARHDQEFVSEERVRSGDTLATLLERLGIDDDTAANFIKSDNVARAILQLRPGKRLRARFTENGELQSLSASISDGDSAKTLTVQRDGKGFKAFETPITLERRVEMRSGEIHSSLFAATDGAQVPDGIAMQMVDIFSTDIDFASDLRRGDRFNIVYETFWQGGDYVRPGRILAAEFDNAGKVYQAVWFEDPATKQGGGYYNFDGKSLKKAFLKSPLQYTRISSGFTMRFHPILKKWKQHKGIDFAAPTGTPIRAAADGVIDFAGVERGYGNVVMIKHWNKISTVYGHMSRFAKGIRRGVKVSQGEVIGYVGMTGWATGPHLHYEFRVNNVPRDPFKVNIPNAQPLASAELQKFHVIASDMAHRFALLSPADKVQLASR